MTDGNGALFLIVLNFCIKIQALLSFSNYDYIPLLQESQNLEIAGTFNKIFSVTINEHFIVWMLTYASVPAFIFM